jgi:acid phosphatase type 7
MRRPLALVLVALLGILAPPAAAQTATFTPEADSFVSSAKPDVNYGLNLNLRVDGNPVKRSYLRFDVQLPPGAVVGGAVLRLYTTTSSAPDGFYVSAVADNTWGESTITYRNAPAAGARLTDSGGWSSGGWRSVSLPAGAVKAGKNSFRLDTASAVLTSFKSRQNTKKPQLIVGSSPACSDGTDNDGDGKVDYPADPGCTGTGDTDEADPAPPIGGPVIGAAGDIATSSMRSRDTAALLGNVDRVLTLGDNAYPDGTLVQFNSYYEPTWGQYKQKTHPSVGNHEYHTVGAAGYFDYFGSRAGPRGKGWYSYDLGSWHLIALNSACTEKPGEVSCTVGSEQEQWLRQDLAAHPNSCVLAYWHHPRWNTGSKGNNSAVAPLWNALYDHGADVVLVGHDHNYQRHAPRNKSGAIDRTYGVRQFTAGTGGAGLYDISPTDTEVYNDTTHGVLEVTLSDGSYAWKFEPVAGHTFTDSGSDPCHGKAGGATVTTSLPG